MTEQIPEPSEPGSVVIDIGGDVGAAAVYTPSSLRGLEMEIRPAGEAWAGKHVAIRERVLPDRSVDAALFPALAIGDYDVRIRHADPAGPVVSFRVNGGGVIHVQWTDDLAGQDLSQLGHEHADHKHADHEHADHHH